MSTDEIILVFTIIGFAWGYVSCLILRGNDQKAKAKSYTEYTPYDWEKEL